MSDFDPFDMDFDGDVDGIDFLGFDYLHRHVLGGDEYEDDHDWSESAYPGKGCCRTRFAGVANHRRVL